MKEIILLKDGELALKGLNRSTFEDILIKNIRMRISSLGNFKYRKSQSTIVIEPENDDIDLDEAVSRICKVFGLVGISRAAVCEKDINKILETVWEYLGDELMLAKTFKVTAKRADKKFPLSSPEICDEVGGFILSKIRGIKVDVHNPEYTVTVEIRDNAAYIRGPQLKGAGGMPTGTGGRACILISGGIDSPVAAYMMAKRGVKLTAVHFASPPYTSELAEMKVHELLKKVSMYSGRINLFTVHFTHFQPERNRSDSRKYSPGRSDTCSFGKSFKHSSLNCSFFLIIQNIINLSIGGIFLSVNIRKFSRSFFPVKISFNFTTVIYSCSKFSVGEKQHTHIFAVKPKSVSQNFKFHDSNSDVKARTNGFETLSDPILVEKPCPDSTLTSSGRSIRRLTDSLISATFPKGKSVLPIDPLNNVSPLKTTFSSGQ